MCAYHTWIIKAPANLLPLLYNTGIWSVDSLALLFTPIKSGLPRLKIYNNILILHHLHIFIQISKMKIPTHTFRCFWCTTVFCIIHDFFGYVMLTILSNLILIIVESSNLVFF